MDTAEKVRENRLRRMAARQGYRVQKSRTRDPRARSHGGYCIIDVDGNYAVAGMHPWEFCFSLEDVEGWLTDDEDERVES